MFYLKSILLLFFFASLILQPAPVQQAAIAAPVLKWQKGGCFSSWCETGWYSSPAVVDLDGDGDVEVIGGLYSLFLLDGATGTQIKSIDPAGSRAWSDIAVADIDNDGDLEVVSVHSTTIHVWDHNLNLVWSRQPVDGNELRSLALFDLDYNVDLEIMVASTRSYDQWFVYEHNGNLRAGDWPQHSPDSVTNGYASGCFNQNISAGDMNKDGLVEIIGSNDTHYTAAFYPNGSQVPANNDLQNLAGWHAKTLELGRHACVA